ncbi:glycosyltransferase family 4 protein [Limnoglobus roseus]|uniref:GT4 family glycosyltransferase n=1 Tax=Limnoglobus roseus TaxID=2598579 RepID=A0A5C1AJH5_9BACT|nr:glycosyltransferase family 4 protein [Limnoglobus roseus]QEL18825.1 GT4 family glycosyltransferase [Limnoglobus roseus]
MIHLTPNLLRPLRSLGGRVKRQLRDQLRGETEETYFDLHDLSKLNTFLTAHGVPPLTTDPQEAEQGAAGAMRYILGLLASNRSISRRDPNPLSAGEGGAFAKSLVGNPFLSAVARDNIRAAFASDPAARVKRVYELREDLRGAWPLALTPKQRGEYLAWLVTFGRSDFQLTPEAAVWFLFEQDEDPSRGLAASFRLHPEWQAAVPHGLTRFGWPALKAWVQSHYQLDCRWLNRATLPPQFRPWDELLFLCHAEPQWKEQLPNGAEEILTWVKGTPRIAKCVDARWLAELQQDLADRLPTRAGVNVLGLFRYTSGLQHAVKSTVESLTSVGVRTGLRDFPVLFLREPRNKQAFDALEPFDVTILNTGIDVPVADAYHKSGLHRREGVYRVGIWWWELEELPKQWLDRGDGVDEIWAPTRFIADAMRTAFRKPVFAMGPGLELPVFDPLSKEYFGLDPQRFTFSFVFDMNSRMQRKNPLGLIDAFRRAFRPEDPVELVIKVSPPETYYKDQWLLLRDAIAATPNVKLVDRVLTRAELLGLLNAADAYVSLHRSEGFGLTCAEAMLLGKPAIATRYSGNLDFMTDDNSYLVDYRRVSLAEDIDPYPRGAIWADPDTDHAAKLMRDVFENREEARRRGERGKQDLATSLSIVAAGERMRVRLDAIRESRGR